MPTLIKRRKKRTHSVALLRDPTCLLRNPSGPARFFIHPGATPIQSNDLAKVPDFPKAILENAHLFSYDIELLFLLSIYSPDVEHVKTDEYSGVVLPAAQWRDWSGHPKSEKITAVNLLRLKGLQVFNESWGQGDDCDWMGEKEVYRFDVATFLAWKEKVLSENRYLPSKEEALLEAVKGQRG